MFKVGQKVVNVIKFDVYYPEFNYPIKGEIYTIRAIQSDEWGTGLLLEEVVNPVSSWYNGNLEICWTSKYFRQVDTTFGHQVCEYLEVITEPELV